MIQSSRTSGLTAILSLTGILLASLLPSLASAERAIKVTGEEWPPFEFMQDGKAVGIDVDVATEVFKRLGLTVEFDFLNWKRAWSYVEEGQVEAVVSTSRKDERKPFLIYPQEDMWTSSYVFFVNKDKKAPALGGYEDVKAKGLTVGTIRGNSYNEDFWAAGLKTEEATDLETSLKKLAGGRIDLVIADKTVGLYTAKMLGIRNQIAVYDTVLFSKGYPMPFASKSDYPGLADIAARYEAELKKLKADGTYDKIFAKWLNE